MIGGRRRLHRRKPAGRRPSGYVGRHWWDRLLYNQTAKRLKAELVGREQTVIADVPYGRGHCPEPWRVSAGRGTEEW